MKTKWLVLVLTAALCICLGIIGKKAVVSSQEQTGKAVLQEGTIAEETLAPDAQPPSEEKKELPELPPRFITLPGMFASLERAPVKFNHDKHARTLEKDGCTLCHPKNGEEKLLFSFPKERDERDKDTLMNSYHDSCIDCHQEKAGAGEKGGPVTCGECHLIGEDYLRREYLPILPEYYEVLRDTYHRDCISCHQEPAKAAEEAGGLDWKNFYVKEQTGAEEAWPTVLFDYLIHDKHNKTLEEKCELCHFISPERKAELEAEGKEPACKDWLKEIDEKNSLTERDTAHFRCLNCHFERKEREEKAGPLHCNECHTGIERTIEEMSAVPRLDCEQEEKILIRIEEARAKAVPFNHKGHQDKTRSCQDCHHQTLRPCVECHTVEGCDEGEGITLAEAYHEASSPWSCIGCHEAEKKKANCAGCHHLLKSGLVESSCSTCHTGTLDSLDAVRKLPDPKELFPEDLEDELEIKVLENEYKPSKVKHLQILRKLTDISNESKLAQHFHVEEHTVCAGCHHLGPLEKQAPVPSCATCHTVRKEPESSTPTLLGAYHQQCLGCHQQMGGTEEDMPQTCTGCHEKKEGVGSK